MCWAKHEAITSCSPSIDHVFLTRMLLSTRGVTLFTWQTSWPTSTVTSSSLSLTENYSKFRKGEFPVHFQTAKVQCFLIWRLMSHIWTHWCFSFYERVTSKQTPWQSSICFVFSAQKALLTFLNLSPAFVKFSYTGIKLGLCILRSLRIDCVSIIIIINWFGEYCKCFLSVYSHSNSFLLPHFIISNMPEHDHQTASCMLVIKYERFICLCSDELTKLLFLSFASKFSWCPEWNSRGEWD